MLKIGVQRCRGERVAGQAKRQTIRADNGERSRYRNLKPGDTLHLWWKSRSPERQLIGAVPCGGCSRIVLRNEKVPLTIVPLAITIPGAIERRLEPVAIAIRDGFDTPWDMLDFFVPNPGDEFRGWLIEW